MSLSAARSELNVAIVGDDDTGKMLADAATHVEKLEAKVRSLQRATEAGTGASVKSSAALDGANKQLTGFAKVIEKPIEGLDKIKGAFEKVVGVGMFVAPMLAGIATGIVAVVSELDIFGPKMSRSEEQFWGNRQAAEAYRVELGTLTTALENAGEAADASAGMFRGLAGEIVGLMDEKTQGSEKSALQKVIDLEELADREMEVGKKFFEAQRQEAELAAKLEKQREQIWKTKDDLLRVDKEILYFKRIGNADYMEAAKLRRMMLADELADLEDVEDKYQLQVDRVVRNVLNLEATLGLFSTAGKAVGDKADKADKPKGGRGKSAEERRRAELDRAEKDAQSMIDALSQSIQALYAAGEEEVDLDAELAAEAKAREERRKKAADEAEKAAERLKKAMEQADKDERESIAQPYIDLANALGEHLGPELAMIEQMMGAVTAQFDKFVAGQQGFADAVAGSAHAVARAVAEQAGGVRALAAVDAAYHLYKGFGTMFTNPAESAGHFIAAAGLGAVAAGIISTGGGAGGGAGKTRGIDRPAPREEQRQAASGGVTYNISAGVMDGQSVSRAIRTSERASAGTGYTREWGP